MASMDELFAFIDRGVAFLSRPVRGEPQGYAHLYRAKGGGWEMVLSEFADMRRGLGAQCRVTVLSKRHARAMAHALHCKPWNF